MLDQNSSKAENRNIRYVEYVDVFSQPNVTPAACVRNNLMLFDSFDGTNPLPEIFYETPNKIYQNMYLFIQRGTLIVSVNNEEIILEGGDSLMVMPENILRIKSVSPEMKCFMFVIYPKLASEVFTDMGLVYSNARLSLRHFASKTSPEQMQNMLDLYKEIKKDLLTNDYEYKGLYIKSLLGILLVEVINIHDIVPMPLEGNSNSRQYDVYCRFISLLNKYTIEHRSVQYYADQLGISSKYLSYVCISYSNKNASTWIDEAVIQKAKALILVHRYSLSEASEILHFSSISSFSRFFARVTGTTPKGFLKEQAKKLRNTSTRSVVN